MSTVSDKNKLNPQDKLRQWLAAVWYHSILISAIHWPQRPCRAPWWSDRDDKRHSGKADFAIYSHVFGVYEELDFNVQQ